MDGLPKELLIEIFEYLDFYDLCELTLTCKSFNEIISNSTTLMDSFRLHFNNDNNINVDLMMKRKFRRIKINAVNENLFKYLECCGENIFDIIANLCYYMPQAFRKILNFCCNCKQLILNSRCFNDDLLEPLSKSSFDSLILLRDRQINFSSSSLENNDKEILINCNSISKNFINFLKKQKQLKTFRLYDYKHYNELFEDESLANVDFQLETLDIEFYHRDTSKNDNFIEFLKNQKSLRKFIDKTNGFDENIIYADVLNDLKSVTELYVRIPFSLADENYMRHESFPVFPMLHIETLTIAIDSYRTYIDVENCFPNVNKLSIETHRELKFVKNFTESASDHRVEVKISENIKTLTIDKFRFSNAVVFDDDVDIKIENIKINRTYGINWLIKCFKNDRLKLKSLTIEEARMMKCKREYLESLARGEDKKIEKLKIYMPMDFDENDDYACEYLMNDE